MGETILQTPIMRELHNRGYVVYLIMKSLFADAFRTIPYIKLITFGEHDYTYDHSKKEINLSERAMLTIKSKIVHDDVIVSIMHVNGFEEVKQYNAFSSTFGEQTVAGSNFAYSYANWLGIQVADFRIDTGFRDRRVILKRDKESVGIIVGSKEIYRRLNPELVYNIVCKLSSDFNVYLFGQGRGFDDIVCTRNFVDAALEESLNAIREMDVFVGTDSGFIHCALSMNKPVVLIQGREFTDEVVSPEYFDIIRHVSAPDELLTCKKNCKAKVYEKRLPQHHVRLKTPLQKNLWDQDDWSVYPSGLDCHLTGVDCLLNIDTKEVYELVIELVRKDIK